MKKHLITALQVILVVGFIGLGVANRVQADHKVKIQDIQLKSKQSDLIQLENKFDLLNKELEQKNIDAEKAKQLETEKADLQKQLEKAQSDLQAKAKAKADTQAKIAQAVPKITQKVYASCADPKSCIYAKESGNRTTAVNSIGCRGLGQACPGSKLPCGDDYACQDAYFTNYAITRYGSWANAWEFWKGHNWW